MTGQTVHKLSPWSVLLDNVKMAAMYGLGAWLMALVSPGLMWGYLAYCVLSMVAFIRLICPYCFRYHIGTCKSGYHIFAGVIKPRGRDRFGVQFKRYVAVLYPVWFLPPLVGIYVLVTNFSWPVVGQLVLFSLVAFVFLPYVSGEHSCQGCENADNCPWRKGKSS